MLRYLLLIILLFGACVDKKSKLSQKNSISPIDTYLDSISLATNEVKLITPEERATIVAGLEKGDYTVLDRFFETNELFPYITVRDGFFVQYYGNQSTYTINSNKSITNHYFFKSNGETLVYTNNYGLPFIVSDKPMLSVDELTNIPQASCSGLTDMVLAIMNARNTETLLQGDFLFLGDSSFKIFLTVISNKIIDLLGSNLINFNEIIFDKYIQEKILPQDFEVQKILVLNHLTQWIFRSKLYNSSEQELSLPYMLSDTLEEPCIIEEST
ncbi:MAG: hypothetical protein ACRCV0_00510 [Brevinema sp.]